VIPQATARASQLNPLSSAISFCGLVRFGDGVGVALAAAGQLWSQLFPAVGKKR